jgi:L-threonylcarbamoyladenylate synthase
MTAAVSQAIVDAVAAIEAGGVVIIPTDTVYGLAATAESPAGRDELYALKGRAATQPTALVVARLDELFDLVPELEADADRVKALLPGPFTLVLANPARRFEWLCGENPASIGVRVPDLVGPGAEVLLAVGAVAATSANLPGGREPRTVDEIPPELRGGAAAVVDGGKLPGVPSTVIDLTAEAPRVLRVGAGSVEKALARLAALA